MASSTAVIRLGIKTASEGLKRSSSTATLAAGVQFSGAPLGNAGNISGGLPGNLASWLPPQRVPLGYVEMNGQRLPVQIDAATWYQFFRFVAEIKLGGVNGPTLAAVATDVIATKAQSAAVAVEQAAVTQQVQANAEALAVTVEVSIANGLSGSAQIPGVVTREQSY